MKWLPDLDSMTHETKRHKALIFWNKGVEQKWAERFLSKEVLSQWAEDNEEVLRHTELASLNEVFSKALDERPDKESGDFLVRVSRRNTRGTELFINGTTVKVSVLQVEVEEES